MSAFPTRVKAGSVLITNRGEPAMVRSGCGEGSYARVYHGAYGRDGIPCALKLPKLEVPEGPELVRREGDLLQLARTPAVVRPLDQGIHDGVTFLVLEWVDGQTVRDMVQARRRLPLRLALEIMEGVATALQAFHLRGTPHGDIRAENVMHNAARGAVVIDPHALPVGEVPPPSIPNDLQAAARLMHYILSGELPDAGAKLSAAAGYNKAAVQLWERLNGGSLTAVELGEQVKALRQTI